MNVHLPVEVVASEPLDCCTGRVEKLRDVLRKAFAAWRESDDERDGEDLVMDEINAFLYGTPPAGKQ